MTSYLIIADGTYNIDDWNFMSSTMSCIRNLDILVISFNELFSKMMHYQCISYNSRMSIHTYNIDEIRTDDDIVNTLIKRDFFDFINKIYENETIVHLFIKDSINMISEVIVRLLYKRNVSIHIYLVNERCKIPHIF